MSDVLFRYLLTARRKDRSLAGRLFAGSPWLAAGLEELVESAAVEITVWSQHETMTRRVVEVPASHRHEVQFWRRRELRRPEPGNLQERQKEVALRGTLRVVDCDRCQGKADVSCPACEESGRQDCRRCSTTGIVLRGRCPACAGSGYAPCAACQGTRRIPCATCDGEGELATWTVETYSWSIERRRAEEIPFDDPRVRQAFRHWLQIDSDRTPDLEQATAGEHLGYETPESRALLAAARATRRHLEDQARVSLEPYLFHRTRCSLVPVGYAVLRSRRRASRYWLVGRGEKALEIPPERPFELRGLTGWLRREAPFVTVGLLPASGGATSWLLGVAHLGSYLGRLTVLDSAYESFVERLAGEARSRRQSDSLTLKLPGGRRVRLVEISRPAERSDRQLRLMLRALDALLILEDGEVQAADGLTRRLRAIVAAEATVGARVEPDWIDLERVRIGRVPLERDQSAPIDHPTAVASEAIRRAFAEDLSPEIDWTSAFERVWRPIEALLADV